MSFLFVLCMSFMLCVLVFASESESLGIEVNNKQDTLEFIFPDKFDPHVAYRFLYPDSTVMTMAFCSKCGYKGTESFSESKYYIDCLFNESSHTSTHYKTQNRIGGIYEWKDTWSLYYNDPHA